MKFFIHARIFFLSIGFLFAFNAQAKNFHDLFSEFYASSGYEEGCCGENIMRFLDHAKTHNLAPKDASILMIKNAGASMFGMVKVLKARSKGRPIPGGNPMTQRHPGESNWYHHVVLEHEGKIWDFDFMNEPTVLKVSDYFEQMFLHGEEKSRVPVDAKDKLLEYVVEKASAEDYFQKGNEPKTQKMMLHEYLGMEMPPQPASAPRVDCIRRPTRFL